MTGFSERYDEELRAFVERLLRFDTTDGNEAPAQAWLRERLDDFGFETHEWTADADRLADHPSFPDDPRAIPTEDRPSVAGVLELGDPDAGPTLVLNGHTDVVPAERDLWETDPFEPTWEGDSLTARGAADMKAGLGACVFAARALADRAAAPNTDASNAEDRVSDIDGRIVVESVAGEEDGGIGAAAAALSNPYPFERDAAIIAEPTDLRPVVATEGVLMVQIEIEGRSAHAATRWEGQSVLPKFEGVRRALERFERERAERVTHPLYDEYAIPWPVCVGRVEAGSWASTVPASLVAAVRVGVAPGESVAGVEADLREHVEAACAEDDWLCAHPPTVERFSVQFEPAEIDPETRIVRALRGAMETRGWDGTDPVGATYGTDARHYIDAGVPTVVFGPGAIEQAHFPNETVAWPDVLAAGAIYADTGRRFLESAG